MDTATVIDLSHHAMWTIALVSAPLLVVALAVGLVIGIIQAATSINEMTLSFIPKLIAEALALLLFGGWMLNTLVDFTRSIFERIPTLFI
jgi:flagellar biosynthetic protein FliQ